MNYVEADPSPHVDTDAAPGAGKFRFRAVRGFVLHEGDCRFPNGRQIHEHQVFDVDSGSLPMPERLALPIGVNAGPSPIVTNLVPALKVSE